MRTLSLSEAADMLHTHVDTVSECIAARCLPAVKVGRAWVTWHTIAGTPSRVLQDLGGWATASMVERYAHTSVPYTAKWAERIVTTARQPETSGASDNAPEGALTEGNSMGWLMGLEPTTTGITI